MVQFYPLTVRELRRETDDAVSIAFEVPRYLASDYAFVQGQHLTLRETIEGEDVRRSYSICSGVDEGELRVAVKKVEGGSFSTFATERLKVGDVLEVMTPTGAFHTPLESDARRHYVAFAAGSGITPILSILKTTLAREPHSDFVLVYGNRTTASILFREALEDIKNSYLDRLSLYHVLSRETQDLDLLNGHIDGDKVRRMAGPVFDPKTLDQAFICGPSTMIDDVSAALKEVGVADDRIHFERFTPVGQGPGGAGGVAEDQAAHTVVVMRDGVGTEVAMGPGSQSILEAGIEAGLDLPFSCKGGVCSTCRAKVLEGEAMMAANYALDDEEVAAGYILTCQSRPDTERLVVDYDA